MRPSGPEPEPTRRDPARPARSRGPSRRAVLAAASAAAVAGCAGTTTTAPPIRSAVELRDDRLRAAVRTRELTLVAAYEQAAGLHPSVAGVFGTIRDQHQRHAVALAPVAAAGTGPTAVSPTATASATTGPTGATTPPPLPAAPDTAAGRKATLAALRTLERRAAADGHARCLTAIATTAALLASITAAETAHDDLLAAVGG